MRPLATRRPSSPSAASRRLPRLAFGALVALAAFALLPPAVARAQKFPEPSLYPVAPELEFKSVVPARITVQVPGEKNPRAYWYMTYTIQNNADKPFRFLPLFELVTEDGKVIRSDRSIPKPVFEAIKKRTGIKLLESAREIEGLVQSGEDQARDGVAIWPEPADPEMGTFSIFAGGLSEEFVEMKDKDGKKMTTKNADGDEVPVIFRKTLHLTFQVLGDKVKPGVDPIVSKGSKWVMR